MSQVSTSGLTALQQAVREQEEGLQSCVHCGFCLPVCPTYRRLGDEADSPRGRLYLMRAVVEGRLEAGSDAFQVHIDRCLGCRACEPVCPSGVRYGHLLELARHVGGAARKPALSTRAFLWVFSGALRTRLALFAGRMVRATGLPAALARILPRWRILRPVRIGMAMLAASAPGSFPRGPAGSAQRPDARGEQSAGVGATTTVVPDDTGGRVGILGGCVQAGLFGRVNDATARVLEANGYDVVDVAGQTCCGALHAHGGDLDRARALARRNVEAFENAGVDWVAMNASGCGAAMASYGELLAHDPDWQARGAALSAKVRDVTQLLEAKGPRRGGPVAMTVAYDAPCHLLHAQGVDRAPLAALAAVPGLRVEKVAGADECCGGAGIYGITHPELGGRIGADKVAAVRASGAKALATGNPGCIMQIGGGLRLEGAPTQVFHPVEILDESYRRGGVYQ